MVIYLWHPVHGTKVAVAEAEAVADEKNGWARFEPVSQSASLPDNERANSLGEKRAKLTRAK